MTAKASLVKHVKSLLQAQGTKKSMLKRFKALYETLEKEKVDELVRNPAEVIAQIKASVQDLETAAATLGKALSLVTWICTSRVCSLGA